MARMTAEQRYEKKKRDVNIGLANNAFGAGAGAIATGTAVGGAKKLYNRTKNVSPDDPEHLYQQKKTMPKVLGGKTVHWGRAMRRIPGPAKVGAGIAGAGLIGMQAVNAGMDAQSALYFAREKRELAQKEKARGASITKSYESPDREVGAGMSLLEPFAKRAYFADDRELERQRKLGRNQALLTGGAVGAAAAAPLAYRSMFTPDERKQMRTTRLKALGSKKGRGRTGIALSLLGGSAAMAAGARYHSDEKKRRWT